MVLHRTQHWSFADRVLLNPVLDFSYSFLMTLFTSDTGTWPILRLYLFKMMQKVSSVCGEGGGGVSFFPFGECWKLSFWILWVFKPQSVQCGWQKLFFCLSSVLAMHTHTHTHVHILSVIHATVLTSWWEFPRSTFTMHFWPLVFDSWLPAVQRCEVCYFTSLLLIVNCVKTAFKQSHWKSAEAHPWVTAAPLALPVSV